jgi:single-strand DNA-binding protein
MANVNKVTLIGNLTRDTELKYTPKGTAVCDISLAINRTWKDGDTKKEETTFVDITLWGRVAEVAGEYCHKGNPLYVEGRLAVESWDDKETGKKRSKMKVIGENIQLLGGKRDSEEQTGGQEETRPVGSRRPTAAPVQRTAAPALIDGDDIPF